MTRRILAGLAIAALAAPVTTAAQQTAAPEEARVYFVNLEDGASVTAPVTVVFGLEGMGVAPAGTEAEATGHHHLLLDRPPFGEGEDDAMDAGLPADDNHIHFGSGQTQTTLDLAPGEYTLQLVLGDANHVPHDPPVMSEQIKITVE